MTSWEEVAPRATTTDPAEKYAASQLRVVCETKDYQLDYLQHALQPGRELIDISPTYQRRLRWPNKKRSLVIESFLLDISVPPIFLFERDYNDFEVIDGRQRLDAISSFLSNEFGSDWTGALAGAQQDAVSRAADGTATRAVKKESSSRRPAG